MYEHIFPGRFSAVNMLPRRFVALTGIHSPDVAHCNPILEDNRKPFSEVLFIRTDSPSAERLAVRDSGFAMHRMAAIYVEELVCVCGFNI